MRPLAAAVLAFGLLGDIVDSDVLLALLSLLGGAPWWVLACVAIVVGLAILVTSTLWYPRDA